MNENTKKNILTSAFASKEDADKLSAEVIKRRQSGVNGQQENEEEMQQKNILTSAVANKEAADQLTNEMLKRKQLNAEEKEYVLTSAFANEEAADQLTKVIVDKMNNAQNITFEKRKNELINEIAILEQEFSDINEKCDHCNHSIKKFISSVEYYETLPQRQKFNEKFMRNGYISILACSLINVCFTIFTVIRQPSQISIVLVPGVLGYSSIYLVSAIKGINETSKENKGLKKFEHDYKKTYERQKYVIQVSKEVQSQLNEKRQTIQQQITNKKIELFQLNENDLENIKPLYENLKQNPFKNEYDCQDEHDNLQNEKNSLVKVKRLK